MKNVIVLSLLLVSKTVFAQDTGAAFKCLKDMANVTSPEVRAVLCANVKSIDDEKKVSTCFLLDSKKYDLSIDEDGLGVAKICAKI